MPQGFFAQLGKPMFNGSVSLTSGTLTATLFTPKADEWTDAYSIMITTNDTATQFVTVSDGVVSIPYFVGGSTSNPPIVDQSSIPIRFKKGTAITATAGSVTAAKTIVINLRGLTSKT